MSGYQMRQWQRQQRTDDEPCPRCAHRMGGHRGMPGRCIESSECECLISFGDLEQWRVEGKVSR